MPLQATSGAASQDAFGGNGVAVVPAYIEEVFSTYLYTGTGASLTITNGIDLSTNGGLVWLKCRSTALGAGHKLTDTARGAGNALTSNATSGSLSDATLLSSFNTTGFTLGAYGGTNNSGDTFVSWSLRKQPKFFDIQTWTGSGANRTISHSLGSVPACILVKRTDTGGYNWAVYHRSLANTEYLVLNSTAAAATGATWWNSTTPTSSVFSLGTNATVNASGGTYVAYIFAHNAGGFGLTGTDNVISCGSYTSDAGGAASVNLGYEPQWLMVKSTSGSQDWYMWDTMRGFNVSNSGELLYPNLSAAAISGQDLTINSTGFTGSTAVSSTFIYIAIRRGPMKVPTDATKVFYPLARTGTSTNVTIAGGGFAADMTMNGSRGAATKFTVNDKLQGVDNNLFTNSTLSNQSSAGGDILAYLNDGLSLSATTSQSNINYPVASSTYFFKRAPSFMDTVCFTGTGSATTFSHNLQAVPELMIVKMRSSTNPWRVYSAPTLATTHLALNTDAATTTSSANWNDTAPTSSVFTVGTGTGVNGSGGTYVNYLFATCAGVSKVGSFTGNGSTQTINCGFGAGGARFVLIKRTDSTGDWYVYDTARGMTTLTDPYMFFNSSAAEVATLGSVTTVSTGFALNSTILAAINVNGGSYIFLAIS